MNLQKYQYFEMFITHFFKHACCKRQKSQFSTGICAAKGRTKLKWFFQAKVSSNKWTNEFNFTTKIPQVDLFSFVFWEKLKTPKFLQKDISKSTDLYWLGPKSETFFFLFEELKVRRIASDIFCPLKLPRKNLTLTWSQLYFLKLIFLKHLHILTPLPV